MGAHARFSPSAANRLIHCPPSLVLGEAFQEEESPYAAEGSAGHALAEHLIKKHLKQQTRRPVSDYYSDDLLEAVETVRLTIFQPRLSNSSTWEIAPEELKAWGDEVLRPAGELALKGEGELSAGSWCRFCKARFTCRQRAEENLKLAQMEFKEPALLTDEEIAEVLKQADELSKWAADVYAYAQDQAIVHHKQWKGFKLVMGKSNRKYTSEEEVAAAAKAAGYTDIYKHTLIGITDMERLMGKKEFARILGALVYKPAGKITLVPESDKREAIQTSTAEADFQKED